MLPGHAALADFALSDVFEWRIDFLAAGDLGIGEASTIRICAATREMITRASDDPANQPFIGTLKRAARLDRSIVGARGFGEFSETWGELELINAEADYDSYIGDYAIDGRRVLIKMGRPGDPYADFVTLFDGSAQTWTIDEDAVRVRLRDNAFKLEVPAQPNVYAGTGDLEGGGDLAGKRKPRAFGRLSNVTPALVIPGEVLYQANDGPVQAVSAVYDSGVALTFSADYATAALLRAATLVEGAYATCLAAGLIRLGGAAFGQVTCDLQGDKTGGTYVETTAGIVRRIVATATEVADPGRLLAFTFDDLDAAQPAAVGYYLDPQSTLTAAEAVAQLMGGIGGWAGFTPAGLLEVRRFDAPVAIAAAYYTKQDLVDIARLALPEGIDPPPWRFRVAYNRNWTVQTDLAGVVAETDPDRVAYLAQPYELAVSAEADGMAIAADHPLAADPEPVEAFFATEAAALAEAGRLLDLYGSARSLYRFRVKHRQFAHEIGQVINLDYPRWGLDGGRYLRIVALTDDTDDNYCEITGFG